MSKVVFEPPDGNKVVGPDPGLLRKLILRLPKDYWNISSGDARLRYIRGTASTSMLILPNQKSGVYLKYFDDSDNEWLSLRDREKLGEITTCSNDWLASVGLFLTRTKAWLAIEEFCKSGKRTDKIEWIRPDEMPENSNW